MFKKFKNIRTNSLMYCLACGLSYPIIKAAISKNKLVVFSDACLLIGFVLIIVGVIYNFVLKGDLDITSFIAKRSFTKNRNMDFDTYIENRQKEREHSFNYPLFVGFIEIIISFLVSLIA